MKFVQICLLISSLFVLGGCSIASQQEEPCPAKVVYVEHPQLNVPDPEPLNLADVSFVVITKANAQTSFAQLEAKKIDPAVWALTDENYKALSINIEKLQAYIMQQQDIIEAYRQYYEGKFDGVDIGHPE